MECRNYRSRCVGEVIVLDSLDRLSSDVGHKLPEVEPYTPTDRRKITNRGMLHDPVSFGEAASAVSGLNTTED